MIERIRVLLDKRPFQPFFIVTSSGQKYFVASPEHAGFNPRRTQVLVWFNDDSGLTLSGLHIVATEENVPLAQHPA